MRYREKRRVDWDEEIRKTERIRRKGFFISALGLGIALLFVLGLNRTGDGFGELSRKLIFAMSFVLPMLIARVIWLRKDRLKRERQEIEQEKIIEQMRRGKTEEK